MTKAVYTGRARKSLGLVEARSRARCELRPLEVQIMRPHARLARVPEGAAAVHEPRFLARGLLPSVLMPSTVADIMNPKLLYIQEGDRLSLAKEQILRFGVTAVPVLDETHRPVGVVSLRDLAREDHAVEAAHPVRTVRGEASVEDGGRTLAEAGVHHLVVVDDRGIAVGMVSALDFVRAFVGLPAQHPPAFERY